MAKIHMNTKEENNVVLEKLFQHRSEAARVFPHCGVTGAEFIDQYQGARLSKASVDALRRS